MKNQSPFPPKTSIAISDDFLQTLNQRLGDCNINLLPWISISVIHPTYLNESKTHLVKRSTLDTLDSLGASFMELILFDIAHEDNTLTQMIDYAHFVQNIHLEIMQAIFDEFELEKVALVGKGEKGKTSSKVKYTVGRQFFGSLALCYGYDVLKSVVYQLTQKTDSAKKVLDYKTTLQEYSQSNKIGRPLYNLIKEVGPDHHKKFIIQVSTEDGKSAQTEGNSKQEASKSAALEYIRRYAPMLLTSKTNRPKTSIETTGYLPITLHKVFSESVCKLFGIAVEKSWAFSQSLTHPSFVNEERNRQVVDNRKHAQLGAKVLETLFTQQISFLALENLSIDEIAIEQYRSILSSEKFSYEGFEFLNLQKGVLLGAGEKKDFYNDLSGKAEFFQAVIGAAFMSHGSWNGFIENLPKPFEDWLDRKLSTINSINSIIDVDPVTGLQNLLQAIQLNHEYKYIERYTNLSLQPEYEAQLSLRSDLTSQDFLLKSTKSFPSKKAAVKHVAAIAAKAINVVNSELGTDETAAYEGNKDFIRLAEFLLLHELSIRLNRSSALQWQKLGILGSGLLFQGKIFEFKLWALATGKIIQQNFNILDRRPNTLRFYSLLPAITEQSQHDLQEDIKTIANFIKGLSPEVNETDVRITDQFEKIISLSKMYKLLGQNWISVNIQKIVEDLSLLRRGRSPKIRFQLDVPEIIISEKDGTYQTILLETLELIEEKILYNESKTVTIFFQVDIEKSDLAIQFHLEESIIPRDLILETINTSVLWDYLRKETPISNIIVDLSGILIKSKMFTPDNTFASQALDAYKMQNLLSKAENQASSQLLHDLKNQLIAYQVSLDMAGKDRTSILKAKFEASQHLDNAISICHSLETVSNSMIAPMIEPIDIGEFIRSYIAEKIMATPLNIRLEIPKTTGSNIIFTSKVFLKSIFENLTRNAVEAMPDGGEIRVDWLYDDITELLMIDISDTGSGLAPEIMNKVKSGRVIDSSKHKGSGIGILSVQSMVERLGGSCSVSSELGKGTQWNITLPSMSLKDSVESNDKGKSLENTTNNEAESR